MMTSLEDLAALQEDILKPVRTAYDNNTSLNFYNSLGEWNHVLGDMDARLSAEHQLTSLSPETTRTTLLLTFRRLYAQAFGKRPDTIEKCRDVLEDMRVTAATVEELNALCPLQDIPIGDRKQHTTDGKVHMREMITEDLDAKPQNVLSFECDAISRWNQSHGTNLQPWDARPFGSLLSRGYMNNDVRMRTMLSGGGWIIGSYGMRKAEKGEGDGWALVSFNAMNDPGIAVRLTRNLLGELGSESRKRLINLIPTSRGKAI